MENQDKALDVLQGFEDHIRFGHRTMQQGEIVSSAELVRTRRCAVMIVRDKHGRQFEITVKET